MEAKANVDYVVVLDAASAIGMFLLMLKGKIGGASDVMQLPGKAHPYILAKDLDWSKLPTFVAMTHIQNPGADDPRPRELVVPATTVLVVLPVERPAGPQPAEQSQPQGALH